jgi:hypothetical protein
MWSASGIARPSISLPLAAKSIATVCVREGRLNGGDTGDFSAFDRHWAARAVTNISRLNDEDDVLRDVGGMVADTLKVA